MSKTRAGAAAAVEFEELEFRLPLSILVHPSLEADYWVATSLERYIVAHGRTQKEALTNLGVAIAEEIALGVDAGHRDDPLKGIMAAPSLYWDRFAAGERCPHRMLKPVGRFPKVQMRQSVAAAYP